MRLDGLIAALLLASACSRSYPLDSVPIEGGSEEARATVERELAFFQEAIAPNTVELSKIVFGPIEPGTAGLHWRTTRRIRLAENLPLNEVSTTLRHELCHALDYQAGLADKPDEVLDTYAERLYDPNLGGLEREGGRRQRRSEAVAEICEVGPFVASAAAISCPGDSPLLADLASFAIAEIWRGVPAEPALLPRQPAVSFEPPDAPFWAFALWPTDDPDLLQLEVATEGEYPPPYTLDLQTGALVEPESEPNVVDSAQDFAEQAPALEKALFLEAVGWPEHTAMVVLLDIEAFPLDVPQSPRERLLTWDGQRWSAVPVCLPGSYLDFETDIPRWDLFTTNGEIWYANADERAVWWSPLAAEGR